MKPSLFHAAPALLLAAALTLSGGAGALAQTASAGAAPATGGTTAESGNAAAGAAQSPAPSAQTGRHARGETMQQAVDARIKSLHASLHITSKQEPEFRHFAQLMRDNAANLDREYRARASKVATMTAPENLESYVRIEQTRAKDVQELVPAFQTLYAALSPQQQHDADALFRSYASRYRHGHQASH